VIRSLGNVRRAILPGHGLPIATLRKLLGTVTFTASAEVLSKVVDGVERGDGD